MSELLASSLDAIVVMNGDHRFVAANPGALDLFGISETNISKFTIDIFLSRGQILDLDCNGSPFLGRRERHGKCMIRRLDGSLRFAQFDFVANFVPLLHLCRFYNLYSPTRSSLFETAFKVLAQAHFSAGLDIGGANWKRDRDLVIRSIESKQNV